MTIPLISNPVVKPSTHSCSLSALAGSLIQHWPLLAQMTRRDVQARYRGSALGMLWSLLTPLLLLAVYTFVFAVVFNVRWGTDAPQMGDGTASFALMLFAGLIVHGFLNECLSRAPGLLLHHSNFVTRVVFPLEIFPWMLIGSALFHACMSLSVLLIATLLYKSAIPLTALALPLVWLPYIILTAGLCWILLSLGVYLRDIGQLIGLLMTVLLFISPVFYPLNAVPEGLRCFLYLNPLTLIIIETRSVLLLGAWPHWQGLGLYMGVALTVAWFGFAWFQKTRKGFADVF